MTMLDEPSTSSAMRRPGYDVSSRVNAVCGSASATAKNGTPSRNTRNAAWRTAEKCERRITGSTAGSATCVRPAFCDAQSAREQHQAGDRRAATTSTRTRRPRLVELQVGPAQRNHSLERVADRVEQLSSAGPHHAPADSAPDLRERADRPHRPPLRDPQSLQRVDAARRGPRRAPSRSSWPSAAVAGER